LGDNHVFLFTDTRMALQVVVFTSVGCSLKLHRPLSAGRGNNAIKKTFLYWDNFFTKRKHL